MKFKKILGLALSAAMAVSAVVPWTGVTAFAAEEGTDTAGSDAGRWEFRLIHRQKVRLKERAWM